MLERKILPHKCKRGNRRPGITRRRVAARGTTPTHAGCELRAGEKHAANVWLHNRPVNGTERRQRLAEYAALHPRKLSAKLQRGGGQAGVSVQAAAEEEHDECLVRAAT